MLTNYFISAISAVGLSFLGTGVVCSQNYPSKPIRIVTGGTGSGNDFTSRLLAQGLTSSLNQQVIVDNKPSGVIPGETVAKAPPDAYILLLMGNSLWLAPFMQDRVPYDPVKDFAPITLTNKSPNILVVHPSLPAKSVKELIALAKARPGELNYAQGASGGSNHLAAELFNAMAGVNIVRVSYKSPGAALTDVIADHVQMMFATTGGGVSPHIESGRLRALAVSSAAPSPLLPGLPTVAASGLPGFEAEAWFGLFAPAKTPNALIKRLNQESVRFLNTTEARERFRNAGTDLVGSSPEEFAVALKLDMARWGKVIKDAGIRAE